MRRTVSWLTAIWLLTAACSASAADAHLPARVVQRLQSGRGGFAHNLRDLCKGDNHDMALLYETGRFESYTDGESFYKDMPESMCGIVARGSGKAPAFLLGGSDGDSLRFVPEAGAATAFPTLCKLVAYARRLPELKKDIAYICTNQRQDRLAFLTSATQETKMLHYCCLDKEGEPVSYTDSFADDEKVSYKDDLHHLCLRMDFLEDDTLVYLSKDRQNESLLVLRAPLAVAKEARCARYKLPTPCVGLGKAGGGKVKILRFSSNEYRRYGCIEELDCSASPLRAIPYKPKTKESLPPITPSCRSLAWLNNDWWASPDVRGSNMYLHLWHPDTGRSVTLLRGSCPYAGKGLRPMLRWWRVVMGEWLCFYLPVNRSEAAVGHLPVSNVSSYASRELTGCSSEAVFPAQGVDGAGVFGFSKDLKTVRLYRFCDQDGVPDIEKGEDIRLGFQAPAEGILWNASFIEYRGKGDKILRHLALQGQLDGAAAVVKIHDLSRGGVSDSISIDVSKGPVRPDKRRRCQMRWHPRKDAPPILVLLSKDGTLQACSISGKPISCGSVPPADEAKKAEEDGSESDDEEPLVQAPAGEFFYLEETKDLLLYRATQPQGAYPYHLYTYSYDSEQESLVLQCLGALPLPKRYHGFQDLGKNITAIASYRAAGKQSLATVFSEPDGSTKIWESWLEASDTAASLVAKPEERVVCGQPLPPKTRLYASSYGFLAFDEAGSNSRLIAESYLATSGVLRRVGIDLPGDLVYLISRFVDLQGRFRSEPTSLGDAAVGVWSTIGGKACGVLRPSRL